SDSIGLQFRAEIGRQLCRRSERIDRSDLRSDVKMDGNQLDGSTVIDRREQLTRFLKRYTKLVDLETSRDMRMAFCVDVGVDANGDTDSTALTLGRRFDTRQLSGRFDVDGFDAECHRAIELLRGLANTSEDDICRRIACSSRNLDFPNGVGIGGAS